MPLISFLKKVIDEFGKDRGSQLSAAFAYIGLFAVVPFLLTVISIVGFIFGDKAVSGQLFGHLSTVVGQNTAHAIENAIAHAHQSHHGALAFTAGIIGTILAAGALTTHLQNSFDHIFGVVPDPKAGFKVMVYIKLKNAVILILGSLVVAVSVAATALIAALGTRIQDHISIPNFSLQLINVVASLAVFVLILYLIYRVLPDARYPKKAVLWTAMWVALLFLIGKIILGWVIGHNSTASAYGAAASLVTLMLWFYYTGQILLLGAEGLKVYADNRDIVPKSKKYTLREEKITLHIKDDLRGQAAGAFVRGYKRKKKPAK